MPTYKMAATQPEQPIIKMRSTVDYSQPSLPHLLSDYGFVDKERERKRLGKEKEKEKRRAERKQKQKASSFDDGEDERTLLREKEKEEYYDQMVKDLHRLRDFYYREYVGLLNDKVEKQRREIRQRDTQQRMKRETEEEEQRKADHRVKKKLERHTLKTTPMTEKVQKTDLYYIVGLEEKMRREGKLKTPSDYNKFRQNIEQPEVFYSTFKVNKYMDTHKYPSSVSDHLSITSHGESNDFLFPMTGETADEPMHQQRSLSRISESRESSRLGMRNDSWAVTQQFQSMHKGRKSIAGRKSQHDAQSDIEKRFPKLEMPNLHCFTMDLEKKPPDPEDVKRAEDLRQREKHRKKMVRTYNKMYQLAMSNAAVSNRILDQHEDMDILFNGPDLCDVIADHHWMEAYGYREVTPDPQPLDDADGGDVDAEYQLHQLQALPEIPSSGGSLKSVSAKSSRSSASASDKDKKKSGSRKSSAKEENLEEEEPKKPMPLTMNEMQDECNIVEAKTLSTLWTNYLRAGK